MKIWVDADACPVVIKEILFRAAKRTGITVTLVANQYIRIPPLTCIQFVKVSAGPDVADNEIIKRMDAGDLVISSDIPLAAQAVEKGGLVLDPHGQLYDAENIRERLNMRDFMDSLRNSGVETGGPAAFSQRDRQTFSNHLDSLLAKMNAA